MRIYFVQHPPRVGDTSEDAMLEQDLKDGRFFLMLALHYDVVKMLSEISLFIQKQVFTVVDFGIEIHERYSNIAAFKMVDGTKLREMRAKITETLFQPDPENPAVFYRVDGNVLAWKETFK